MVDPFFIVGNSRSGTTVVSRILNNHADVYVLNETHFFEEFSSQIERFSNLNGDQLYHMANLMLTIQRKDYYRKSEYEEYPNEANQILSEYKNCPNKSFQEFNKIFFKQEASRQSKKKAGDQTPRHVFYVDDIFRMYPDAKVIHMVRDPRAVLFSQKKKWASGLRRKQPLFEIIRTFINYHPVTMSILWNKSVNAGIAARKKYGSDKLKTIIFEEFVEEPENTIQQLCRFLDIEFIKGMIEVDVELSATALQEGKKGVRRAVANQWKNRLSGTEVSICEKHTGDLMKEVNYQLSFIKPSSIRLLGYYIWFPLHLGIAFLLNFSRMGNPITYISKRLFNSSKQIN